MLAMMRWRAGFTNPQAFQECRPAEDRGIPIPLMEHGEAPDQQPGRLREATLGQDRHGRVVAIQAEAAARFSISACSGCSTAVQAPTRSAGPTHAQVDAFSPVSLALAGQRLMLAEPSLTLERLNPSCRRSAFVPAAPWSAAGE